MYSHCQNTNWPTHLPTRRPCAQCVPSREWARGHAVGLHVTGLRPLISPKLQKRTRTVKKQRLVGRKDELRSLVAEDKTTPWKVRSKCACANVCSVHQYVFWHWLQILQIGGWSVLFTWRKEICLGHFFTYQTYSGLGKPDAAQRNDVQLREYRAVVSKTASRGSTSIAGAVGMSSTSFPTRP